MGINSGGEFRVEDNFLFIGRTFEEYLKMFGLEMANCIGSRILDCPGGPGSFTAVASALGADVTAVDPEYGPPPATLESRCEAAVTRNVAQLEEKQDLFVWDHYGDVETRGRYLQAAYERFLADYQRHHDRYIEGALPDLPFDDGTFDLTLSANFLFLYDDRLNDEFHLAALQELYRVTKGEVRVFPLASLDRERSDYVDLLVDQLREGGVDVTFQGVPYEFQPNVTEMLLLS